VIGARNIVCPDEADDDWVCVEMLLVYDMLHYLSENFLGSRYGFDAVFLNDAEQSKRRPARLSGAALPIGH
jgi:hypothetical protein